MEPKNGGLEDVFPFPRKEAFSGFMLVFGGVTTYLNLSTDSINNQP